MAELLRRLGVRRRLRRRRPASSSSTCPSEIGHRADYDLVRALRASISVLGPLVARIGSADVAIPGGDAIGSRGLDLHAAGLEALGREGARDARLPRGRGARAGCTAPRSGLDFPSVGRDREHPDGGGAGAGHDPMDNAAREPEIVDIARDAQSRWAPGSAAPARRVIDVEGVAALHPDRARRRARTGSRPAPGRSRRRRRAATSRSSAAWPSTCASPSDAARGRRLRRCELTDRGFRVALPAAPAAGLRRGDPALPGFPTDLQPFALTYNAVAEGSAMVTENLFEARFRTVQELARLGADARSTATTSWSHGVPTLSGAPGRGQRHPGRGGAGHRRPGRRGRSPPSAARTTSTAATRASTRPCGASARTSRASPTTPPSSGAGRPVLPRPVVTRGSATSRPFRDSEGQRFVG